MRFAVESEIEQLKRARAISFGRYSPFVHRTMLCAMAALRPVKEHLADFVGEHRWETLTETRARVRKGSKERRGEDQSKGHAAPVNTPCVLCWNPSVAVGDG